MEEIDSMAHQPKLQVKLFFVQLAAEGDIAVYASVTIVLALLLVLFSV